MTTRPARSALKQSGSPIQDSQAAPPFDETLSQNP